jgi:hypothetical protein
VGGRICRIVLGEMKVARDGVLASLWLISA